MGRPGNPGASKPARIACLGYRDCLILVVVCSDTVFKVEGTPVARVRDCRSRWMTMPKAHAFKCGPLPEHSTGIFSSQI